MVDCTVAMVQCTVRYSGTVAVVAAGWQQSHDSSPQSPHTAARLLLGLTTTASTTDTGNTAATSCGWAEVTRGGTCEDTRPEAGSGCDDVTLAGSPLILT